MPEFILLMHGDAVDVEDDAGWSAYLDGLGVAGHLRGGSAIGDGRSFRKAGTPARQSRQLTGFVRVVADDFESAAALLAGNPVYEAGGTVEIRELPETG